MIKSGSKELTFVDLEECAHDVNNAPETSEETSFGSIQHKVFIEKK